jgi:putative salt-induced outer membrane protein YdiY
MRHVLLLACFAHFLVSAALADQVLLKNGDRLSGTIVRSDGKELSLTTSYAGDIDLKFEAIERIESRGDLYVEFANGRTARGPVTTSDGNIRVATSSGPVESPLSSVKTLRSEAEQASYAKTVHAGPLEDWKGALNLGFALTRGNSQTKNLSLAFSAVRQTVRDKLSAYANTVYAANDAPGAFPSTTANTEGGGFRYDHDVTPRVFGFGAVDFFADALQGLNLRSVFGGGAGYHAIKSDRTTLDLLAGLNYTHESYTVLSRNLVALTLGEELMHKLAKSTTLNERAYFFPDLNSAGDYRATFDLGTITKMSRWLGWQNTFSDVYVTNPPPAKRNNDLIFTTGLNVSFGQRAAKD